MNSAEGWVMVCTFLGGLAGIAVVLLIVFAYHVG